MVKLSASNPTSPKRSPKPIQAGQKRKTIRKIKTQLNIPLDVISFQAPKRESATLISLPKIFVNLRNRDLTSDEDMKLKEMATWAGDYMRKLADRQSSDRQCVVPNNSFTLRFVEAIDWLHQLQREVDSLN